MGYFRAKVFFYFFGGGISILDDIVEKSGSDTDGIEIEIGDNVGDSERVDQVGLTRLPSLSTVLPGGEQIVSAQKLLVHAGVVHAQLFYYRLESNHCFWPSTI